GDVNAFDSASPVIVFGAVDTVNITGGNLEQPNGRTINVSGIGELKFLDGMTSQGVTLPAQNNEAELTEEGVNVTDLIVKP
ncbi:MAG TPA: hypothetical protein VEA63_00435, partial [Opitutus sp.]|nr:hypothetical protein [Opitutus sp.]